ncbi:MAG TPA: ABC transporter permease [Bryobacteraceae bacterium]|nr:ABC transporter permease [Bryobacteraceae bacterium]
MWVYSAVGYQQEISKPVILLNRLLASLRKGTLDADLDAELRFHLDMETAENIRRGMRPEEARYAAQRSFGGVQKTKDAWRDRRYLPDLEAAIRDMRYALRSLLRTPAFTCFGVITLALGIGANTAVFSALHALVLRPLPYPEQEALAAICETSVFQGQATLMSTSAPNLLDWREQNQVFDGIGAYTSGGVNLTQGNATLRVPAARVEPEVFRILRVKARLGRYFFVDENQTGRDRVVILSDGLWSREFGADSNVIGREISVNGADHVVIGVMPPEFQFPPRTQTELWTPLSFDQNARRARGSHWLMVIARLKPGISWAAAQLNLNGVARRIGEQYGRFGGVRVQPLHGDAVRATEELLVVLSGAVGFVLLLACANVSSLILARAAGQRRELAVRVALGAGRWRIVRLLWAESLALSILGGAAGLWGARLSVSALRARAGDRLPVGVTVSVDASTVWFCAIVTLVAALLAGLIPALRASRVELVPALKDTIESASPLPRHRPNWLVVAEIALSLTLVIGATLLVRSLRLLGQADLGFRPERVLTMKVALPQARADFYDQLLSNLKDLPGVTATAAASLLPVESSDNRFVFTIAGAEPAGPGREPGALVRIVTTEYFDAMGIPLLRGRCFRNEDTRGGRLVAVINRRAAESYFPNRDAVGKSIALGVGDGRDAWMTVVGVVGNHWNGDAYDPVPAMIFTPLRQFPWPLGTMSIVTRTSVESVSLVTAARRAVKKLDAGAALFQVKTMEKIISDSTASTRFLSQLLTVLAALALSLALVGVYGVMSYIVSRRTHEVGVKMALGASRGRVLLEMLSRGLVSSFLGAILGLVCAVVVSRGLRGYMIGVPVLDLGSYLTSAVAILGAALVASFVPAWRASRVDSLIAMRCE